MGPQASLLPLIALTLLGVAFGVGLILFARRARRIDDHPTCRRCRFDLVGLGERVESCPECGSPLAARKAIRLGNRRVHKPLMVVAILVVFGSIIAGGGMTALRATKTDFARYKPVWLLARDVRDGSSSTADEALAELERRLVAGDLSDKRARDLVAIALARQGDSAAPWSPAWASFLEAAWVTGTMTGQQRADHLLEGLSYSLDGRKRMGVGRSAAVDLVVGRTRLSPAVGVKIEYELASFDIGGQKTNVMSKGSYSFTGAGGPGITSMRPEYPLTAPLGDQILTTVWKIRLADDDPSVPKAERTVTLTHSVLVVGKDQPLVELLHDPAMGERVRQCISASDVSVSEDGKRLNVTLAYSGLPCRVIGNLVLRERNPPADQPAREWRANQFSLTDKTGNFQTGWGGVVLEGPTPFNLDEVDIVLRPSVEAAINEARVEAIWGEDVVIEGVKVERTSDH